jgi:hypothetical protein
MGLKHPYIDVACSLLLHVSWALLGCVHMFWWLDFVLWQCSNLTIPKQLPVSKKRMSAGPDGISTATPQVVTGGAET